jgi:hypothetical protein
LTSSGQTVIWPADCDQILEVEIAKKIVESELLVQEDQVKRCYDYLNIFAEKFSEKKLAFLNQNKANFKKIDHNIGF